MSMSKIIMLVCVGLPSWPFPLLKMIDFLRQMLNEPRKRNVHDGYKHVPACQRLLTWILHIILLSILTLQFLIRMLTNY